MKGKGEMRIKKINSDAIIPTRTNPTDAGLDLYALGYDHIHNGGNTLLHTGIAIEIPPGYFGLIKERSGMSLQGIAVLGGVIDSGYRGEIKVNLQWIDPKMGKHELYDIGKGDKIAQLLILPILVVYPLEVNELTYSERGEHGFGSSGK